ncbi:MAG: polymerase sporulation-specific sigma factor [Clostridiales bacterium]|jgi:RNA polymerase sporulation-specific sigma factor|nr:polymerase sporulation-specific sigma factor [Clostridiales bacterium]MDK2933324.1 polymerase sporulation-specific sigma factor [Clostridiales bacterium]
MDHDTLDLINRAKGGDKEAQGKLIETNIGLVWSIVKKFQNRGYEPDDLFQIGCIGLIKAIQKFDQKFDVRFSTYAVPMIMGEIKRFIRDDGIIKVSRSLKETANKARIVKEMLMKSLGREPTVHEVADKLKIEVEDLVLAMDAGCTPESLYTTLHEGDSSPILLIDRIDEGSDDENKVINRIALRQVLDTLKPREKQIIILRYFKEKTQTQIANMLGISQVQVSRIEKKILSEMKKRISAS